MIFFNEPPRIAAAYKYLKSAIESGNICGDGPFTKRCDAWIEQRFHVAKSLLTPSGTAALEMAALLCDIKPGDEVILPSFTFSSTATAFALTGATLVFVDIRPDTMNIDERLVEQAITSRTRVIVAMHYAGVACEMDALLELASLYKLKVVEDAAQAIMSSYRGNMLGSIGDFGCFSFHETKNYSMGEGGAFLLRETPCIERAEILREKGTNRSRFLRGQVDKYTWVDYGSSYLPSELGAAYLWSQFECADEINASRIKLWNTYYEAFSPLERRGLCSLAVIPPDCVHNAHLFYIKCADLEQRTSFIAFMRAHGVQCVFHYVPLHSSVAGKRFGRLSGQDRFTTKESERLVRLPLYYDMSDKDRDHVIDAVLDFFNQVH